MFGTEWMIEEEFEPIEPWTSFEAKWFESIREAMKKVEDGKKQLDSGGDKKAWKSKKRARREERARHTREKVKGSS